MSPLTKIQFSLEAQVAGLPVSPDRISWSEMARFHKEVEAFLRGTESVDGVGDSLVSVVPGSYALLVKPVATLAVLLGGEMEHLRRGELDAVNPRRAEVVETWQAQARKDPTRSVILLEPDVRRPVVRVSTESDFRRGLEVWVNVELHLSGTVIELGGQNPNLHLVTEKYGTLIVAATQEQLRDEATRLLYRPAALRVQAKKSLRTGTLNHVRLIGFETKKTGWDQVAFDAMVKEGTKAWAHIPDTEAWLADIRGEKPARRKR